MYTIHMYIYMELLGTHAYHNCPYIGFWLQEHLPLSVRVHSLAWSLRVEGLGEIHQRLAQPNVPHFSI